MHNLTCSDQLRLQSPKSGRLINEDGVCVNIVDLLQQWSGIAPTSTTVSIYSASNGVVLRDNPVGGLPLLSIRPKSTKSASGISVMLANFGIFSGCNAFYELFLNATLTGASWVSAGGLSIVESDVSATAVSGGTLLSSGYITQSNSLSDIISSNGASGMPVLGWTTSTGLGEVLTVKVTPFVPSTDILTYTAPAGANIEWRESE